MNSSAPKVLHKIAGREMINHVLNLSTQLKAKDTVVVVGKDMTTLEQAVAPVQTAVQSPAQGTGDAAKVAFNALSPQKGTVLVLYGDVPLISKNTCEALIHEQQKNDAAVAVLAFRTMNPAQYGRVVADEAGNIDKIVEFKDASEAEQKINLCNSGIFAFDASKLGQLLKTLTNDNAQGEYYLTDCVHLAREKGWGCRMVETVETEVVGVNNKQDLAVAEHLYQNAKRAELLTAGVTMIDPNTVYLSYDTEIGDDVIIEPNVFFGPNVKVGNGVHIKAYCHLEDAVVGDTAIVGPFARLRPGTKLGTGTRIGNFVEIKNTTLGDGSKVNHLSYIGDADVGKNANLGAGTITCNYDGFKKQKTTLGDGTFVGSNSTLVAPVTLGDNAYVAAGSLIRKDVTADALAHNKIDQIEKPGWTTEYKKKAS